MSQEVLGFLILTIFRINKITLREYVKAVIVCGSVSFGLSVFGNDYLKSKVDFRFLILLMTFLFIIVTIFWDNWDLLED